MNMWLNPEPLETAELNITDRLIKRSEVCGIVGLSPSTLYRRIQSQDGPGARFPSPIRTGPRSARWSENEVLDWVAKQKIAPVA